MICNLILEDKLIKQMWETFSETVPAGVQGHANAGARSMSHAVIYALI